METGEAVFDQHYMIGGRVGGLDLDKTDQVKQELDK